MTVLDVRKLNSIKLGNWALTGRDNDSSSLKMEGDNDMNELIFRSS